MWMWDYMPRLALCATSRATLVLHFGQQFNICTLRCTFAPLAWIVHVLYSWFESFSLYKLHPNTRIHTHACVQTNAHAHTQRHAHTYIHTMYTHMHMCNHVCTHTPHVQSTQGRCLRFSGKASLPPFWTNRSMSGSGPWLFGTLHWQGWVGVEQTR